MIKVVVAITTFNLEKYIEQALDSVLMQKTTFKYKIIVADDCSSDNTLHILHNYQKKYPEKIEVLSADKNLGSLANSNRIFDGLECEYFTFLDGDDYWVSDDRLQRQVDFLDKNPTFMMCAGNTQFLRNEKLADFVVDKHRLGKTYSFDDMLHDNMPFFHTSSILIRNTIFIDGLPQCYVDAVNTFENCALRGEDFRRILHLERGPLYAFNDTLSVYRIHENGVWQGSSSTRRAIEGAIGYNFYYKYFGEKYGLFFKTKAIASYQSLMRSLVADDNLLGDYSLNAKDSKLFLAYLNDIRDNSFHTDNQSKLIKKIKRVMLKMLFTR